MRGGEPVGVGKAEDLLLLEWLALFVLCSGGTGSEGSKKVRVSFCIPQVKLPDVVLHLGSPLPRLVYPDSSDGAVPVKTHFCAPRK